MCYTPYTGGDDYMFKEPNMATGSVIPLSIKEMEYKELKRKYELKQQHRHDYLVATYGIIGGVVSGLITSLIVGLLLK